MIPVLIGFPGSGKTTARRFFEEQGFVGLEASDYMKYRLAASGISIPSILGTYGEDVVARDIADKICGETAPLVVSGFRTVQEMEYFSRRFPTTVIHISTPLEICFRRVSERDVGKYTSLEHFVRARILPDLALGLGTIIERAQHTVYNHGAREQLREQLKEAISRDTHVTY